MTSTTAAVIEDGSRRSPRSWYPDLPSAWAHGRVKSIARRVTDGAHISPDTNGGVYDFVSTRDLHNGQIDFSTSLKTTYETYQYMVRTGCQPWDGDVLFSKDGTVGSTALVKGSHEFVVASSLVIITPNRQLMDSRFLQFVFLSKVAKEQAAVMMRGAGLPRLSVSNLARIELPVPPLDEQRRIVDFLDQETAQIDALIAKQKQLIEILHERRQAVLDTEFEALVVKRVQLRRGIRFLTSGSRGWGDYYAEEGDRFVRIGNLPRINLALRGDIQYVQLPPGVTEGARTRLQRDDLLFSITAYLGSVAVVPVEWVGAYVSQHVALCRLDLSIFDSQFVGYFMLTTEGQDQLKLGAAGGTKVQVALDDIKALSVPVVPVETQRKIVASIEVRVSRIDALISKAEEFIALARERRAALITEAVTGRIDVLTGKMREVA